MQRVIFYNSLALVLLIGVNELLRSSLINDFLFKMDYRLAQQFMEFPFGYLPLILGAISLTLPIKLALDERFIGFKNNPSWSSLLILNPLLVYSICNIDHSQFGLMLFSCPI